MQVTNTVEFTPAIINVNGANKVERQLSVARHASAAAQLALVNAKGKLGQAARGGVARNALDQIARAASVGNYRPIAEYIAATLGEPLVITSRSSFESLPDQFDARIAKIKLSKSGGYTTDKKTGMQVPNASHKLMLTLRSECVECIARATELVAEARAAREADQKALAE